MKLEFGGPSPEGWHSIQAKFSCDWEQLASHIRGIEPAGRTETPAGLAKGLLLHAARARWFTLEFATGSDMEAQVLAAIREEAGRQKLPINPAHESEALAHFARYVEFWRTQPHPRPLASEYPIGPTTIYEGAEFTRTARLDDVSWYPEGGDALWLGECKTTSTTISETVQQYELHGQTMLQMLLWRRCRPMQPVAGVMLDLVPTAGKDYGKFARVGIHITDFQLEWFTRSLDKHLREDAAMKAKGWDAEVQRNPSACLRPVSGGRVMRCQFWNLCKFGRQASGEYQLSDGRSLLDHKPVEGKERMPWE